MAAKKAFAPLAAPSSQPHEFNILRMTVPAVFEKHWIPTMYQIFDDPDSFESKEQYMARLKRGDDFFLMWDVTNNKPAGIELIQVMPESGVMFIPATGVLPEYRNLGIGAAMTGKISAHMNKTRGGTHTVVEVEDPQRLHNVLSGDELAEGITMAHRRINFWRRQNCIIVDDPTRQPGEKLAYVCPNVHDRTQVLDSYHMGIRFDDPALQAQVVQDGRVNKAFVRATYLDLNRIHQGHENTEAQLRDRFVAIDQYFTNIDAIKEDTLPIHTAPLAPKNSPTANFTLSMKRPAVPFMTAANSNRRANKPACA